MLHNELKASKILYFPSFPIKSHMNLRIRKPLLYPY